MLACAPPMIGMQVTMVTVIEWTFMGWVGPPSWYSSCPCGFVEAVTRALPPKFARSPFPATIHPPCVMFTAQGGSQASPTPSPLVSFWSGLKVVGQLSQASPTPSPSASVWAGLGVLGQLSCESMMPSMSASPWAYDVVTGASTSARLRTRTRRRPRGLRLELSVAAFILHFLSFGCVADYKEASRQNRYRSHGRRHPVQQTACRAVVRTSFRRLVEQDRPPRVTAFLEVRIRPC